MTYTTNIPRVIRSRRMWCAGQVECMEEKRIDEFWSRNHLTETIWKTCVDGRIVNCTLKKKRERGVDCIHLIQDRGSWLAVVNINEPWNSMKCRKFLDKLRDCLLANLYTYSISRVSI